MALWDRKLLKYGTNYGAVVMTGKRVNRVAGYCVELPSFYTFEGDDFCLVTACYIYVC